MSGRIVLPLFVDAHTHIDKGHIWRRKRNPVGDFASALAAAIEDRAANWTAADVAARMEFSLRSAYAHGTTRHPHPYRQRRRRRRASAGRSSPTRASAGAAGSTLQAAPLFSIDFALDRSHMADVEAMLDAHGTGILGAVTYMVPRLREGLDAAVRARRAQRLGARLPCRRERRSGGALAQVIADMAIERRFARPHPGRPLLLARAAGGRRTAKDDRRRRARRDQRRLAADVQPLPSGPPRRPHAALARRHRAARTQGGRRQRDDRQRQHARSVLRLWRSRHDGGLARGRADPASRLSVRRLGAGGRGRAGPGDGARPRTICAPARPPT